MGQYQLLDLFCGRRCFLCTSEQQPRAFVAVLVRGARLARSCAYPRQTAASRPQGVSLLRGCRKQRQRGCLGATRKEDNLTQRRLGMGAGAQAPVGGDGFRDLAVQVVRRLFGRLGHHCPPLPRRKSVGNGLPQRRYRRVPDTKSDEECAARQGKCRVHCQCVAPVLLRTQPPRTVTQVSFTADADMQLRRTAGGTCLARAARTATRTSAYYVKPES